MLCFTFENMSDINEKRKGVAEKVLKKKLILLQNEAKSCSNIKDIFSKPKVRIYFIV